jgi:hypothetical protein
MQVSPNKSAKKVPSQKISVLFQGCILGMRGFIGTLINGFCSSLMSETVNVVVFSEKSHMVTE